MIRIRDIGFPPEHDPGQLAFRAAKVLRIRPSEIKRLTILRRSIDARKKPEVRVLYTVEVETEKNEEKLVKQCRNPRVTLSKPKVFPTIEAPPPPAVRPVVVGFGPAGMFAALILAQAGWKPLVLERGDDALTRSRKVEEFFKTGRLDPESNVQFGEGGAGTFSDGKLNTGVNNPRIGWILEQFVEAGASQEILYDAKPHVGTDVLLTVVQNLRKKIQSLGGEVRFRAKVTGIRREKGALTGLIVNDSEEIPCKTAILALGHSARDTFSMLLKQEIPMEPKPFSMGVRIEQKQKRINKAQYGAEDLPLPPADYKLVRHLAQRTVYTFCMCPGGFVVGAASEEGGVVTNGMSYADRGGENANSALLVTVNPADFPYGGPLGGMLWQRQIEQKAYALSGSYRAPCQTVGSFLGREEDPETVVPTYRPGVVRCDLHQVLPKIVTDALEEALPQLDQILPGFASAGAVMTGPETRSSSPVRILRGENRASVLEGLYPCGEGAGYAGGIMSAAIDGILTAEAILRKG